MSIRVFLIDDHTLVRHGIKLILSNEVDIHIVGEADTGERALPTIRQLCPDIVLCDIHLPGVSGLEITDRLASGRYASRVIILSVMEDGPVPQRALEVGAFGYVDKSADVGELLRAVRDVAMGKRYLSIRIAQKIALSRLNGQNQTPFDGLSKRELEVAILLTRGFRQEVIAKRLNLSAKTINTHKARLFEKIGIQDNIALARLATQYGLLDLKQRLAPVVSLPVTAASGESSHLTQADN